MKLNKLAVFFLVLVGILLFPLSSSISGSSSNAKDVVVLSKDNTAVLSGEVNGDSVGAVMLKVKELNRVHSFSSKPIYLFLNTPGGEIQAGLEMLESLRGSSRQVNTITLFSASMGFQIVQNLGDRLIVKNGIMMSHRAAGEISGYFGGQAPSQMDSRYALWLSRIKEMDQQTVSRTKGKQTLESYQKAYADELWLTGNQSVEQGYSDRVVVVRCDSSLDGVTTHTVSVFGLTLSYDLDNCPLNTSPMNIRVASPPQEKTPMTAEQVKEVQARFTEQYAHKQHSVVPMY